MVWAPVPSLSSCTVSPTAPSTYVQQLVWAPVPSLSSCTVSPTAPPTYVQQLVWAPVPSLSSCTVSPTAPPTYVQQLVWAPVPSLSSCTVSPTAPPTYVQQLVWAPVPSLSSCTVSPTAPPTYVQQLVWLWAPIPLPPYGGFSLVTVFHPITEFWIWACSFSESKRRQALNLVRLAYSSINVDDFAVFMGMPVADAKHGKLQACLDILFLSLSVSLR